MRTFAPGQTPSLGSRPTITALTETIDFKLVGDFIELNQLLKVAGVCDSASAGKALVVQGNVQVGGLAETRKAAKIRAGQIVTCGTFRIFVEK